MNLDDIKLTPEMREKLIADGSIKMPSPPSGDVKRKAWTAEEKRGILDQVGQLNRRMTIREACEQLAVPMPSVMKWRSDRSGGRL